MEDPSEDGDLTDTTTPFNKIPGNSYILLFNNIYLPKKRLCIILYDVVEFFRDLYSAGEKEEP